MKRVVTTAMAVIFSIGSVHAQTDPLIEAARVGDLAAVSALLSQGVPVDNADSGGVTALAQGAYNNQAAVVKALLAAGADPSRADHRGRTPWIWAAARASDDVIGVFLETGVPVDTTIEHGVTALMLAALQGHTATVRMLLHAGADPSLRDRDGDTAADWAHDRGHVALARLVEDFRPESELRNAQGEPYLSAVEQAIVEQLNWVRTDPAGYAEDVIKPLIARFDGKVLRFPGEVPVMTEEGSEAVRECYRVLKSSNPVSPLSAHEGLSKAAKAHVRDQGPRGALGHTGSDGSRSRDRIERFETSPLQTWGENVAYGWDQARRIVFALLVDDGVSNRGHRKNIMNPKYANVGVSVGEHSRYGAMCVMDFATFR